MSTVHEYSAITDLSELYVLLPAVPPPAPLAALSRAAPTPCSCVSSTLMSMVSRSSEKSSSDALGTPRSCMDIVQYGEYSTVCQELYGEYSMVNIVW
jgi:hypothetical protein